MHITFAGRASSSRTFLAAIWSSNVSVMLFIPIIKISIAKISRLKNHCISETSQKKVAAHISWFKEYDKYSWLQCVCIFSILHFKYNPSVIMCWLTSNIFYHVCVGFFQNLYHIYVIFEYSVHIKKYFYLGNQFVVFPRCFV